MALIGRMDVIGPLLWSFNMYKLLSQEIVFMVDRNVFIPFDPANTDYAEYLKWLEAGNTPLPADTPES